MHGTPMGNIHSHALLTVSLKKRNTFQLKEFLYPWSHSTYFMAAWFYCQSTLLKKQILGKVFSTDEILHG